MLIRWLAGSGEVRKCQLRRDSSGLRRFIKGFVPGAPGSIEGYNVSVVSAELSTPWDERLQRDGRRERARFAVTTVDPTGIDNRFLHALLLDYGSVAASEPGIAGRLRDYLVGAVPGSDELLLSCIPCRRSGPPRHRLVRA